LNECKKNQSMPGLIKECYYTEDPTCFDGIKNCHDGSCEILIDCGGPCPWLCPPEAPFKLALIKFLRYLLALLIAALIMIILIKINRIRHINKKIKEYG